MTPTCGAKAKSTGKPCRLYPCKNGRCHLHGGKSTGPKTPQGKMRSKYARLTHGFYSEFEQEEYREMRREMKESKDLIMHVDKVCRGSVPSVQWNQSPAE